MRLKIKAKIFLAVLGLVSCSIFQDKVNLKLILDKTKSGWYYILIKVDSSMKADIGLDGNVYLVDSNVALIMVNSLDQKFKMKVYDVNSDKEVSDQMKLLNYNTDVKKGNSIFSFYNPDRNQTDEDFINRVGKRDHLSDSLYAISSAEMDSIRRKYLSK